MLVAFNTNPKLFGGGGFHFVRSLGQGLNRQGHSVAYDLKNAPDAIIIVVQDAKSSFDFDDAYLMKKKRNTKIILRVNNLDTHAKKGSIAHYKKYLKICDSVVYMSEWAKKYAHDNFNLHFNKEFVIHNCPQELFLNSKPCIWDGKDLFRIVTHHWSINDKKGFSTYGRIGRAINNSNELKSIFHLCYIGRSPKRLPGFVMKPFLRGQKLVDKICAQHVYLTASELEVGPNHVAEGLSCGLPVLYGPRGGAISEYVGNCGFEFNNKDPISSFWKMRENYSKYSNLAIQNRPNFNQDSFCNKYLETINS